MKPKRHLLVLVCLPIALATASRLDAAASRAIRVGSRITNALGASARPLSTSRTATQPLAAQTPATFQTAANCNLSTSLKQRRLASTAAPLTSLSVRNVSHEDPQHTHKPGNDASAPELIRYYLDEKQISTISAEELNVILDYVPPSDNRLAVNNNAAITLLKRCSDLLLEGDTLNYINAKIVEGMMDRITHLQPDQREPLLLSFFAKLSDWEHPLLERRPDIAMIIIGTLGMLSSNGQEWLIRHASFLDGRHATFKRLMGYLVNKKTPVTRMLSLIEIAPFEDLKPLIPHFQNPGTFKELDPAVGKAILEKVGKGRPVEERVLFLKPVLEQFLHSSSFEEWPPLVVAAGINAIPKYGESGAPMTLAEPFIDRLLHNNSLQTLNPEIASAIIKSVPSVEWSKRTKALDFLLAQTHHDNTLTPLPALTLSAILTLINDCIPTTEKKIQALTPFLTAALGSDRIDSILLKTLLTTVGTIPEASSQHIIDLMNLKKVIVDEHSLSERRLHAQTTDPINFKFLASLAECVQILPDLLEFIRKEETQKRIVGFHGNQDQFSLLRDLFTRLHEAVYETPLPKNFTFFRFDRSQQSPEHEQALARTIITSHNPEDWPDLLFFTLSLFAPITGSSPIIYAGENYNQSSGPHNPLTIASLFNHLGITTLYRQLHQEGLLQELQSQHTEALGGKGALVVLSMTPRFAQQYTYAAAPYGYKKQYSWLDQKSGDVVAIADAMKKYPDNYDFYNEEHCLVIPDALTNPDHVRNGDLSIHEFFPGLNKEAYARYEATRDKIVSRVMYHLLFEGHAQPDAPQLNLKESA